MLGRLSVLLGAAMSGLTLPPSPPPPQLLLLVLQLRLPADVLPGQGGGAGG